MLWFEAFIYIFNLHWDKVDNYRIDKYLMFLRFQFNGVLLFLKSNKYGLDVFLTLPINFYFRKLIGSRKLSKNYLWRKP